MIRNEEIYKQALTFRKRGFTYEEIAKICGVSKSTVANWCKGKAFSKKVAKENAARVARDNKKRMGILNKARQAERAARYREAARSAETEYRHYKSTPLFTAGLMLYKALGDIGERNTLRFASADSSAHGIFLHFAREYLGVEEAQIHFSLTLAQDTAPATVAKTERRWHRALSIYPTQCYKTQFVQQSNSKALQSGVGNTIISNTVLKVRLMKWIEFANKDLLK